MGSGRFESFVVASGESDLWIGYNGHDGQPVDPALIHSTAMSALEAARDELTVYARSHPGFLEALEPCATDQSAPPVVVAMLEASSVAGVGPMAAVAGAIAESVGRALVHEFPLSEIVVENGGDLWIKVTRPLRVSVYAGFSSLSDKVAVEVDGGCSIGLACSSGTVGPSLSFGKADAAVVLAENAALADAWATALGNRVHSPHGLDSVVAGLVTEASCQLGALAIIGDTLAAAGNIKLAPGSKDV